MRQKSVISSSLTKSSKVRLYLWIHIADTLSFGCHQSLPAPPQHPESSLKSSPPHFPANQTDQEVGFFFLFGEKKKKKKENRVREKKENSQHREGGGGAQP